MAKWELREMEGYSVVMRTEDEVWVAMLGAPEKMTEPEMRERQATVLKSAAELVEDANHGAEAAEGEAMVDHACGCAEAELKGRSPAWVAANLVREAVLILTMDRPKDMGDLRLGKTISKLGSAMKNLKMILMNDKWLDGRRQAAPSVSQAAADDGGNIG